MLTVDDLALLEVLLQKLNASIYTSPNFVVCAYLNGYVVSEGETLVN